MRFSRLEHRGGQLFPSPGDLPNPGIKPGPLMSPALAGRFFTTRATWEAPYSVRKFQLYNTVLLIVVTIFTLDPQTGPWQQLFYSLFLQFEFLFLFKFHRHVLPHSICLCLIYFHLYFCSVFEQRTF